MSDILPSHFRHSHSRGFRRPMKKGHSWLKGGGRGGLPGASIQNVISGEQPGIS